MTDEPAPFADFHTLTAELRSIRAELAELKAVVNQYKQWAVRTGDYPHDEEGCDAHYALLKACA